MIFLSLMHTSYTMNLYDSIFAVAVVTADLSNPCGVHCTVYPMSAVVEATAQTVISNTTKYTTPSPD